MGAHPADLRALAATGLQALRAGDNARACETLRLALSLSPGDLNLWIALASGCRGAGDSDGELAALDRALEIEPRALPALLMRGAWFERAGDEREAARAYGGALAVAPPFERLPQDLRNPVRRAVEVTRKVRAEREAFLRDHMAGALGRLTGEKLNRFEESLDVALGNRAIYRQQPHVLFFPGLPCVQFPDRDLFPWLPEVEAATDMIREELRGVLEQDEGMVPYLRYPSGKPIDQFAELNHSPRWSAFHFDYEGAAFGDNRASCPKTVELLSRLPQPKIPGLSPASLFSILKPRTHIPAHTGATNARLLCHLPLILPENCRFRCGNETRPWTMGEGFVFDDTIEHEAWNDSDKVRVVLIFDIWNPWLTEPERELIGTLFEGFVAFDGTKGFDS